MRTRDRLRLATSPGIVRRGWRVAAIVGTILVLVNHGDALLRGDMSWGRALRILTTLAVPYCVSTYSSVCALLDGPPGKE